ncbi:hypothetical protein [Vibrio owensii]|uniref:hypothetical protein n=1 Tax=Vibrio harveyi group TaxID=717610 RepID=UPI003CC5BC56
MKKTTYISVLTALYFNALMEQGLLSDKGAPELGGAAAELTESAEIAVGVIEMTVSKFTELNAATISVIGMQTIDFLVDFYRNERAAPDVDSVEWTKVVKKAVEAFEA